MSKIIHTPEDNESRPLPAIFPKVSQSLAIGSVSAQSSAFDLTTGLIRLCPTVDCYVAIGANPTATSSSMYLPAGSVEYFGCSPGEKVAVLRVLSNGFLNIVEAQ